MFVEVPTQIEVLWRLLFERPSNTEAKSTNKTQHRPENGHSEKSDNSDFMDVVAALILERPLTEHSDENANNAGCDYSVRTCRSSTEGILSCTSANCQPHEDHQASDPPHQHHGQQASAYNDDPAAASGGVDPATLLDPALPPPFAAVQTRIRELIMATIKEVCFDLIFIVRLNYV